MAYNHTQHFQVLSKSGAIFFVVYQFQLLTFIINTVGAIIVYSGWGQSSQPDKHMQSGNHGNHAQRNLIHYRFLSRSRKSHVEIKDDAIVIFIASPCSQCHIAE